VEYTAPPAACDAMTGLSETRYANTGDGVHIAYRVMGEGPDLLVPPDGPIPIDAIPDEPHFDRFLRHLARFSRVILFDRRGMGLSDPVTPANPPTLENWVDDAMSVLDAVGSVRAGLLGMAEGGFTAVMLAATHPDRVSGLVLVNATPGLASAAVTNHGAAARLVADLSASIDRNWGDASLLDRAIAGFAPSMIGNDAYRAWLGRATPRSMSPAAARAVFDVLFRSDIADVAPSVQVPTLVLHRSNNRYYPPDNGRFLASAIPDARYVEVPGADHVPYLGDTEPILIEIEEFLTGSHQRTDSERVLATVLFVDMVASTERAVEVGDRAWRDLLDRYRYVVRERLHAFYGREINTRGDDFLVTFDGPARAIRCALALCDAAESLGVEVRVGIHTGEIEMMGDDIGGIAVHIGARVAALARPGAVLVSRTVVDLVAGSGITFAEGEEHELKGVPGAWRLFQVSSLAAGA
jgi:class 3 adenylate cyclase/pimeloyl-ACP methyl ester carboxylesterase